MRRVWMLAWIALAVACAAPSERLARPRVHPEPAMVRAAAPPPPSLTPLPPGLRAWLDARTDDQLTPAMRRVLPQAGVVVAPGRPLAGGDALALADRALHQGDARDAAVQLAALIDHPRREVRIYARWRLARALLQLGRGDEAEPLLREVAASHRPEAWAALTTLAERVAARDGADVAAAQLAGLALAADGTAAQLEAVVLDVGPVAGRVALLVDRARRGADDEPACASALAALVLDSRTGGIDRIARCRDDLERGASPAPVAAAFRDRLVADRQAMRLEAAALRWRDLDARAHATPADWIWLATMLMAGAEARPWGDLAGLANWGAVVALGNAAVLGADGAKVTAGDVALGRDVARRAWSGYDARAEAIVRALSAQAGRTARVAK
ncbi:MAG: tetratricopeptide repeat protein [Myxococcales bacterium]|nr:tetratricopeptide repeat protein [Myxococcales bacterium]MBK7196679.1 tetratricopeptide repeat protein [Myxococcales bacterium]